MPWAKDSLLLPAVAESLVAGVLSTDSPIVPELALFDVLGGDGSDDDSLFVPPVVADSLLEAIRVKMLNIPFFNLGIIDTFQ